MLVEREPSELLQIEPNDKEEALHMRWQEKRVIGIRRKTDKVSTSILLAEKDLPKSDKNGFKWAIIFRGKFVFILGTVTPSEFKVVKFITGHCESRFSVC